MSSEIDGKFRQTPYEKWKFIEEWCQKNHVSPFDEYWYKCAEESYLLGGMERMSLLLEVQTALFHDN